MTVRSDIFSIEFPQNEKIRQVLSIKNLNDGYSRTKQFDKTAALVAAQFKLNEKIKRKIKVNKEYLITWQKLCSVLFAYLLGPAKFLDRSDANELVCLPFVTKLIINNSLQTVRGISIYNSTKWIGTFFFRDPEFNDEFAFYGQNDFISTGSWASKVRADVQKYNLYGLTKGTISISTTKSVINETTVAVGNTITVKDLFSAINKLKEKFE